MHELKSALKQTRSSNVCGNDGVTPKMIINCNNSFIEKYFLFFFRYIFKYCVVPDELNITHIIPIKKDKGKSINDINNLRPISISNCLAQIFERLLLMKMKNINITHANQFGYKNKTSCSHALFIFKETVIHYLENKKHCFAVFLDAIKAFDNLWRQALFLKLKRIGNIILSAIILLKVYYDKLSCKIKVNNVLSKLIKLARGVKQGGILSGDLFNFFIDDLIHECCNAGVGVFFIDIIIAILCFCDDVCLLSPNEHDMQILLNICDNYSKKWGLEYNTAKCKFIVFGSNKLNNTNFILNNLSLSYCNNIKYLGVEFTNNLNFNDFFLKKFLSVTNSFFSLNSFGFKPCGINPFLQSQVYKSFCLSRLLYSFEILSINKKHLM